jgi:putative peptidoglycan lipid II flippase
MVTWTLTAVAAGVVGQSLFFVSTQAAYSVGDTATPFRTMVVQATLCIAACALALTLNGLAVLTVAGAAYAGANLIGGVTLVLRQRHRLAGSGQRLGMSALRVVAGSAAMAGPTAVTAYLIGHHVPGRLGWTLAVVVAGAVGLVVYGIIEGALHSPELGSMAQSVFRRRYGVTNPQGNHA